MKRASDYPAYLAMRAALAAVRLFPRGLALGAGGLLGQAARLAGMRRRVTDENLAKAFPELGAAERADLGRRVFRHFGRMAVDSLRLSAAGPQAVAPLVTGGDAVRLVRDRLPRGKGVIILTGHVGNWELAGAYLGAVGFPLAAVVKPPSNPYVAEHTERSRRQLGIETIPLPEARAGVMAALRQGRVVALVADQGALRSATWAPFFGQPTRTPAGPGLFALRSGAPVLFGALVAQPDGSYHLDAEVIEEEVTGEAADATERIARKYRAALEALVRRVPEQYLWTHRLWKWKEPPAAP
jgi:KDO2-lipid IV(A) lauroyltransferase